MITFADFVTNYWNKTRRSGALWNQQSIADDSGMSLNDVASFLFYCHAHEGMTDAQLIATNPQIITTPGGLLMLKEVIPTAQPGTLQGLLDELRVLIQRYGG
jgi:hypothetical protein